MQSPDIYGYIKEQENDYETSQIQVGDNWTWNMRDHVQLIFHLKNGVFYTGDNNWLRAFKNIMEPILNLAYWSEDIEVKDIVFFIEDKYDRFLSWIIKKYHDEVFVKEYNLDTFLDEVCESDVDYGGVLTQETKEGAEVIQFQSIAFCDQTDVLGAPVGLKFHFSPGSLRKMSERGWGKESNGANISIDELITLADDDRSPDGMQQTIDNKTPGKQIEVYIVKGYLPEAYEKDNHEMETYYDQVHVCAFYTDPKGNKHGVSLYRKKGDDSMLKFHTSKKIHGRALGRGVGESLLHPQIWTNFLTIHKTGMLEAGSKSALVTDDPAYTNKNKIQDMEQNEITTIEEGKQIWRVPTLDPNQVQLFEGSINEWYEQAQLAGSAFDSLLGQTAPAGTTFKGQERTVQQGSGIHNRRRGQRAKFIEEHYRDIFIPKMKKDMLKGKKFLAQLSIDELQYLEDALVQCEMSKMQKEYVLSNGGAAPTPEISQMYEQQVRDEFKKKGNKHLLEVLKGELEDVEITMGINIAGKQKDLASMSDKVMTILQTALVNPQNFLMALQIPGMSAKFEDVLEFSNISQVDFKKLMDMMNQAKAPAQPPQQGQPQQAPQQPQQAQPTQQPQMTM